LDQRYAVDAHADIPLTTVLSTGRSVVSHEVGAELLARLARDADHQRLIEALGTQAFMLVPIQAHGRILGAMLCASTDAARTYTPEDLRLAEELAYRAALAIDNAMLYQATSAARDLAEEAIRLRDLFFSIASHELKTPLTSLLLQIQLLQRRSQRNANLAEQDQRTLAIVASQTQRLDRMISSLLDVSRIELGQLSLHLAPVDLCALARRVVNEVQPTSEAHPIACHTPATPLIVAGDELRLEQVLQNLLQNAIKYSPDGGQIEVDVAAQGCEVSLTVADRGIGLPVDALVKIFDRFYRASNADPRQISGMGVGLYVVQEIVRLHGGRVDAERRAGGGSRFVVRVPQATRSQSQEKEVYA
jgi:signal transduction histidine kinase